MCDTIEPGSYYIMIGSKRRKHEEGDMIFFPLIFMSASDILLLLVVTSRSLHKIVGAYESSFCVKM